MTEAAGITGADWALTLAKHPPRAGERVLDVGCDSFATTFELARLVGRKGLVVGLDGCARSPKAPLETVRAAAPATMSVGRGDICAYRFEHAFDRVFARLLTGCFGDPRPALACLRTALRPGGWLVMVGLPAPGGAACGPSPFASAEPDVVRRVASGAGYDDVAIDATLAPRGIGQRARGWVLTARTPQ